EHMTIPEARAMVAAAQQHGSRELLRRVGNDANSLGVSFMLSGEIEDDEDGRGQELADEACAWFDVTEAAWRDFAVNGLDALELNRVRVEWMRPGRPDITAEEATERLLRVVR